VLTIITTVQLDTIGTANALCHSIGKLDVKIVEHTGNIEKFHRSINMSTNA
jgi:hypothetical protein